MFVHDVSLSKHAIRLLMVLEWKLKLLITKMINSLPHDLQESLCCNLAKQFNVCFHFPVTSVTVRLHRLRKH